MHDSWVSLKFSMFIFNFLHEKDKNNYANNNILKMTLSLNCKEAGAPVCTHTMYGDTEEELLVNAKRHGMEVQFIPKKHGMKRFQRIWSIFVN